MVEWGDSPKSFRNQSVIILRPPWYWIEFHRWHWPSFTANMQFRHKIKWNIGDSQKKWPCRKTRTKSQMVSMEVGCTFEYICDLEMYPIEMKSTDEVVTSYGEWELKLGRVVEMGFDEQNDIIKHPNPHALNGEPDSWSWIVKATFLGPLSWVLTVSMPFRERQRWMLVPHPLWVACGHSVKRSNRDRHHCVDMAVWVWLYFDFLW